MHKKVLYLRTLSNAKKYLLIVVNATCSLFSFLIDGRGSVSRFTQIQKTNHTLKMCLAYKAVIFFSPRQIGHRKVSLCLIDKKGDLNFKKLRGDKLNHTIHIRNQRDLIKKKAS